MKIHLGVKDSLISDVKLCIFDKDGTLIDVHTYWANMILFRSEFIRDELGFDQEICKGLMESMGVNSDEMSIKPEGPVGLKKREIVLRSGVDFLISKGYPDQTELFLSVFKKVDEYSLQKLDQIIKPLPGVHDLFQNLKSFGCLIALATTDIRNRAKLAMKHLKLLDSIDEIIGADGVNKPKPDPEIVYSICKKVGVKSHESVMIGDAETDILTGLNAGCKCSIGVESGLTTREQLLTLTPYVVSDVGQIKTQNIGGE